MLYSQRRKITVERPQLPQDRRHQISGTGLQTAYIRWRLLGRKDISPHSARKIGEGISLFSMKSRALTPHILPIARHALLPRKM